MKITYLNDQGIHQREIVGVEALKQRLPKDWFGYASMEIVDEGRKAREVDVAVVLPDRIVIADLKDWHGSISSDGSRWSQNSREPEASPVPKIALNAKVLSASLKRFAHSRNTKLAREGRKLWYPTVQGCVILTGTAKILAMPEGERQQVFTLDDFIEMITDAQARHRMLPDPGWVDHGALLEKGGVWRQNLDLFFTGGVHFRAQELRYADNRVLSAVTYRHPRGIYEEFDTQEANASQATGLLRTWDFSKADARFHSPEGREEIADRERVVLGFLTAGSDHLDSVVFRHKVSDPDKGMRHWEIFERRRELKRLSDFIRTDVDYLTLTSRRELIRTMLCHVAAIHGLGATHEDIGAHSIWLALPSTVRISHFMAARYPETRSLGELRFNFLSHGVEIPEDFLGGERGRFGRDVFLLGTAAHQIAFGIAPTSQKIGEPADWSPETDENNDWTELHGWFKSALHWDPACRFADAGAMLDAFNAATAPMRADADALTRLESFRSWQSLFELMVTHPMTEMLRQDANVIAYRSELQGDSVLVKCWRPSNWTDVGTDAFQLLAFCERSEQIRRVSLRGVVAPSKVAFLPEGLVLVQPYLKLPTLSATLESGAELLADPASATSFLIDLCETLEALDQSGLFHGDLSPSNILVSSTEGTTPRPLLIDLVDFRHKLDGELRTGAYAPAFPSTPSERDRFAALKVAEEVLGVVGLPIEKAAMLESAIRTCRDGPPKLLTLEPLTEALRRILTPLDEQTKVEIRISGPALPSSTLASDDGAYGLVMDGTPGRLLVVGAVAELVLDFYASGTVRAAWCRDLKQSEVAWRERRRAAEFVGTLSCERHPNLITTSIEPLLKVPEVATWLATLEMPRMSDDASPVIADPEANIVDYEDNQSLAGVPLEDVQAGAGPSDTGEDEGEVTDVRTLWRTWMEVEAEQQTEVFVEEDSTFSRERKFHIVRYSLISGTVDYQADERVFVRRKTRNGGWVSIGRLVNSATSGNVLAVAAEDGSRPESGPLCRGDDVLRLESLWEVDSRRRRHTALRAITEGRGAISDLAGFFEPSSPPSNNADTIAPSPDRLMERYELNESQAEAMAGLWHSRPLGLLQGPPGTGKTTFIAALVHYVLTSGVARNVLIASQSHEAVNTAAEGVVKLFRKSGSDPRLVRVGQEAAVSSLLRPFHSTQIEEAHRARFRSKLKDKLQLMAKRVGAPEALANDFIFLEITVRPIIAYLASLTADTEQEPSRTIEIRATLSRLLATVTLPMPHLSGDEPADAIMATLVSTLVAKHRGASPEHARRLMQVAELARDWLNTTSGRHRNFESFLVATRSVVCGTCVGVGSAGLAIAPGSFDMVIIDEAARCSAGELAVPMVAGRWVVLVGDHRQLEPQLAQTMTDTVAARLSLPRQAVVRSDFERAFASPHGRARGSTLDTQYRMLPTIGKLVSWCFYDRILKAGRTNQEIPEHAVSGLLPKQVTWLDTSSKDRGAAQTPSGTSLKNETEATAIVELLKRFDEHQGFRQWVLEGPETSEAIGIVCMYGAQRDLLRRKVAAATLSQAMRRKIKVATVDGYQGKENIIVIVSLVRNNHDGPIGLRGRTIAQGFMARPNRINVALSRARDRLVIVGSIERWPDGSPMADVSEMTLALESEGLADVVRSF